MFRLLALFLSVTISLLSVIVVYYNKIPYLIDFHFIQFSDISLGVLIFIAMLFGIFISTFFLIGLVFSGKKKYRILKKDHDLISKEVQNLRRMPIQE
ncbi:hypothetical protein OAN90_01875 [Gammaproteobacteria bacterium]|nr:hypothetical protein [Gammaproteobacteria bacterium]